MIAGSVLITGCSRGLGLEMVRQLLTSSTPPRVVIGTCRNPDQATELQALAEHNSNLKIIKFDVVDYKSLPNLLEQVRAAVGPQGLNLLINNAGILEKCSSQMFGIPLENLDQEVFSSVMETNTTAPLMLVKVMLPLLREAASVGGAMGMSRAAVVNLSSNLSSMGAFVSKPGIYGYRASKAALNMLTKTLAMDLGEEGLMFVVIHPGWVQTDMGTSSAMLTPQESISAVLKTLSNLTEKHNGLLISYDGTIMPW